jgi:hypothetical protein
MSLKLFRLVLGVVLLSTWLIGGIAFSRPAHGAAKSGDLSAASKMLSQSGMIGSWEFASPNSPEVECYYPKETSLPLAMTSASVKVNPAYGLSSQEIWVDMAVTRRLPGGALQWPRTLIGSASGTATTTIPAKFGFPGKALDLGSTFVQTITIRWMTNGSETGRIELLATKYRTHLTEATVPIQTFPTTDACYPKMPATAELGSAQGTVGANIHFTLTRFPNDPNVGIYFDGTKIAGIATDTLGNAAGSFVVPAAPIGQHTVKFYRYGRSASVPFTIKPRIKVIPNSALLRGQTVNVSLRGYAAHEMVNIRWIKNGSFVHIAYVTTSSTGSANVNVSVPKWVPDGSTKVRGDGSYGHAQTNAVTVSGGPFSSSTVKPAPTQTPPATATPEPTSSAVTETATPETTVAPTEQPATPEATVTETATPQPTETATPADTETPTEAPTIEPTVVPSETPDVTATEGNG